MMLALLKNKLFHIKKDNQRGRGDSRVAVSPKVFSRRNKTLTDLTEAETTKIGRSFALLLLTTTEPSAAVDAWKLDNKVLTPLFADHAWFEPMINVIAKQVSVWLASLRCAALRSLTVHRVQHVHVLQALPLS